jgi:hypothetical protein
MADGVTMTLKFEGLRNDRFRSYQAACSTQQCDALKPSRIKIYTHNFLKNV